VPAYQASKAALNNVTIALAKTLTDTPIKVTSVCPGFVQTELTPANRTQAPLTAAEAAELLHRAATLPDHAASGTFIDAAGVVPWCTGASVEGLGPDPLVAADRVWV
jgi:NAD(P)-dependent dehydrogenase (short-subunit alcohol dehydrogenase family)